MADNMHIQCPGLPIPRDDLDALHIEGATLVETAQQTMAEIDIGNQFSLQTAQPFLSGVDPDCPAMP